MTMRGLMSCFWLAAFAVTAPSASADDAVLNPLRAIEKSSLDAFLKRPLFSPSRRAPEPPTRFEPAPPPVSELPLIAAYEPPPPPKLRLTGVIATNSESVAVVKNLESDATEKLRLGDVLDGWLVTSIEPIMLRMTLADRDEEFRLFERAAAR